MVESVFMTIRTPSGMLLKEKHLAHFASSWFGTFVMLSCTTGSLVGHENTWRRMVCSCKHL